MTLQTALPGLQHVTLLTFAMALVLTGCASQPINLGQQAVDRLAEQRGRPVSDQTLESLIGALDRNPIQLEDAVALALANNPEVANGYLQLRLGAAQAHRASRIRNPVLAATILNSNQSRDGTQLGFDLVGSFTDLLTLGARKRLVASEFQALQQEVAAALLVTAAEAERAYYDYVAAQQIFAMQRQIAKAAQASLELAARYHQAGNLSPRQFALAQATAAEMVLAQLEAQEARAESRQALANVLGIAAQGSWQTSQQLPQPATTEDSLTDLIARGLDSRLDLAAARMRAQTLADQLQLTARTSGLGELDLGLAYEKETDGAELIGPVVAWEVPLFIRNKAALVQGRAELEAAIIARQQLATAVSNQVQLAHAELTNAQARADIYRQRLIPARIAATDRAQEEANYMLIGSFELIQAKQDEYTSYLGYLAAVRDYWIAHSALRLAVGDRLTGGTPATQPPLDVEATFRTTMHSSHQLHGRPQHASEIKHNGHAPAQDQGH